MSFMKIFTPKPISMESLCDIVEDYFPKLDWSNLQLLTGYIKARTEDELQQLNYPEKVVYEDYFFDVAKEFAHELLKGSFYFAEHQLKQLKLTSDGMDVLLKQKFKFEVENYGWDLIPSKYLAYAMEYGLEKFPPKKNNVPTEDDTEEEEQFFFNAPRISKEQYLHRRHRKGHMKDVARHGWQGKYPRKCLNGKGYDHESKIRTLKSSQRRVEKEAW